MKETRARYCRIADYSGFNGGHCHLKDSVLFDYRFNPLKRRERREELLTIARTNPTEIIRLCARTKYYR